MPAALILWLPIVSSEWVYFMALGTRLVFKKLLRRLVAPFSLLERAVSIRGPLCNPFQLCFERNKIYEYYDVAGYSCISNVR